MTPNLPSVVFGTSTPSHDPFVKALVRDNPLRDLGEVLVDAEAKPLEASVDHDQEAEHPTDVGIGRFGDSVMHLEQIVRYNSRQIKISFFSFNFASSSTSR